MSSAVSPQARMANDIARQFGHLSEQKAAERIATHVEKFWDPRMVSELLGLVRDEDASLDPLVIRAMAHWVIDDVDHQAVSTPSGG